ncbi:hypothetical protein BJY01DRAFT_225466 [Aspergillus pseudoustus]|uniref:Uncharacterized protein n=1 Tax=Aspergillus pseudoustus TaxID=1810923 RepID=A0ABR4IZW5_9EURO
MHRISPGRKNMTAQLQRPLFSQPTSSLLFSFAPPSPISTCHLARRRLSEYVPHRPRSRSSPIYPYFILVAMMHPPAFSRGIPDRAVVAR